MRSVSLVAALLLGLAGCTGQGISAREAGALGGAGLGAGLGAIIGNQSGHAGAGVAIGSALGALAGGLVGNSIDKTDRDMDQREDRINAQQREIEENRRLLDELRASGADVRTTDRGVVVSLPDVLFEFDSAKLTGQAVANCAQIARVVEKHPERHISVEGHTDSLGTAAYNQRLSLQRARSVYGELAAQGVSRGRMSAIGFGEGDPIASNATEAGRRRNRRVEVIIENRR